jgi:DNA-binding PadR family transcriptional regulator
MSPRAALPLRLEYIILGLIRRKPVYGYELLQNWNKPEGLGIIWRVKPGTLYAALEKMENLGYLESTMVPGEASPTRKEYRITLSGEQSFNEWFRKPVSTAREFRQDFVVKLFFINELKPDEMNTVISSQYTVSKKWLTSLQEQYSTSTGFQKTVISYRLRQVQGILDWLLEISNNKNYHSQE